MAVMPDRGIPSLGPFVDDGQVTATTLARATRHSFSSRVPAALPGMLIVGGLTALAMLVSHVFPVVSTMIVAIGMGAVLSNTLGLHRSWRPGIGWCSKYLLRAGIVLLGLQTSLGALGDLGVSRIVLVVCVVAVGVTSTIWIGRRLGLADGLVTLIACGFSICGAAAIAGAKEVSGADEDQTGTALMLVVVFGTVAIPVVPWLAQLIGLDPVASATWIGASVHEVAQVVAAASIVGPEALAVAVPVKLGRVVCLAGVVAVLALRRRSDAHSAAPVPGFVVGFLAMVVLGSVVELPAAVLGQAKVIQTIALTMAMAGLGTGIDLRAMVRTGGRPLLLGAVATVIVSLTSLVGVLLIGQS